MTDGRFGKALDARVAGASAAGKVEYRQTPLIVECWAGLVKTTTELRDLMAYLLSENPTPP